jgi:hypothetical protein
LEFDCEGKFLSEVRKHSAHPSSKMCAKFLRRDWKMIRKKLKQIKAEDVDKIVNVYSEEYTKVR